MRVCSGHFVAGMKAFHVRGGKEVKLANALTFMASDREIAAEAYPGDVIGIHNHGTISIGDTFTEGEAISFTGIPNFAPELFRRARLRDPLKLKQRSEEHTSELQSLMCISYAVFCLKKKNDNITSITTT